MIAVLCGVCTAVTLAGLIVFLVLISVVGSMPTVRSPRTSPVTRRPVPRMLLKTATAATFDVESDTPFVGDAHPSTHPSRSLALYATQRHRRYRCLGPRLVGCSENFTSGLVRHHAWFFVPSVHMVGGGSCLEWIQGHMCHDYSQNRFHSRSECRKACESGVPRSSCTRPLDLRAVYDCPHSDQADTNVLRAHAKNNETRRGATVSPRHWWFYDPVHHACRNWTDVCVFKSYATMAECTRACIIKYATL